MAFRLGQTASMFKVCSRLIAIIIFSHIWEGYCQNPAGLRFSNPTTNTGYVLLSPRESNYSYLIDKCGINYFQWVALNIPGESTIFSKLGVLLRTQKFHPHLVLPGGYGGKIVKYGPESDVLWEFQLANDSIQLHHDLELLPNGNILCMAWVKHSMQEAILKGRNLDEIIGGELWSERIIEIRPLDSTHTEIVWYWDSWDHLIQERDSTLENFGSIGENPNKIDINYAVDISSHKPDWLHANSIAYQEDLDLIAISVRSFNEIWVIDHSTTIEEAKDSSGGRYGKGGDLLFRWGNPEAYDRGTIEDRKFFFQHDVNWIDAHTLMVFNNGADSVRPYSSVDKFYVNTALGTKGFPRNSQGQFFPEEISWTYFDTSYLYAPFMSSAQLLPNGNLFICLGTEGRIVEVDTTGKIVWDYVNPVDPFGPVEQGATTGGRQLFHAQKYPLDYPGLEHLNLVPGERLERNPLPDSCELGLISPSTPMDIKQKIQVYPNPFKEELTLINPFSFSISFELLSPTGQRVKKGELHPGRSVFDLAALPSGIYGLYLLDKGSVKIVKLLH